MILIPEDIEALIFDLDGTLVHTMDLHIAAWNAAGRECGVEITASMINAMAGVPSIQSVLKLNEIYGWDLDPLLIKKLKDQNYRRLKQEKGNPLPVLPIFATAESNKDKLPMAVGTGSSRLNALETLRDLKIIDWFKVIIAADDVENHKPFPDTFLKCAERMGIAPSKCLVFEDGDLGILAAKNANMKFIDVRKI